MATSRAVLRTASCLKFRPSTRICPRSSPATLIGRRRLHLSTRYLQASPAAAMVGAPDVYPTSHEQISTPGKTQNFLDNQFVDSKTTSWIDLYDPATNNLVTRVPQTTDEELKAAVASAQKAFPAWKATSLLHKQQIMFKFVALIRQHWDRLAKPDLSWSPKAPAICKTISSATSANPSAILWFGRGNFRWWVL